MTLRPVIFISATGQSPRQGRVAAILLPLIAVALAGSLGWWFAHSSPPARSPIAAAQAPPLSPSAPSPGSQDGLVLVREDLQDHHRKPRITFRLVHPFQADIRIFQALKQFEEGDRKVALADLRAIQRILQHLAGAGARPTLNVQIARAVMLHRDGNTQEAQAELRAVLDRLPYIDGPIPLSTSSTLVCLSHALSFSEFPAQTKAELQILLAIQERSLGSDHPDILRVRDELAAAFLNSNEMEAADAEYRTILAIRQRTLGAEHPDTLQTFHQLAEHLMYQHRDAEAEAEFRRLLAIQERILGATAPDTLRSRSDIGSLLTSQHRYPEAEAHYRSLLSDLEKIYGAQHEEVLWVHLSLAYVLEVQNRLPEALVHVKLGEKLDEYNSLIPPDPISLKRSDYLQRKIEEAEGKEPGR